MYNKIAANVHLSAPNVSVSLLITTTGIFNNSFDFQEKIQISADFPTENPDLFY